jgi:hypothetical protein
VPVDGDDGLDALEARDTVGAFDAVDPVYEDDGEP